jgi:sugar phosphate permease
VSAPTLLKPKTGRIFYGWVIVAAGFVNQMIAGALIQRSYGAYVVLLREEFGWSKAALSGVFSMQQIENGLLGPIQGMLLDKFGPKLTMRAGIVMFGGGMIAFSFIDSLLGFYVCFLVIALGNSLGGFFPLTVVLVNWFNKKRAKALSTMQLGGALGGVLVPLVALALEAWGWRTTALVSGIAVILICVPITALIEHRPEDRGLLPDGDTEPDVPADVEVAEPPGRYDFTLKQAMRTPAFWLISMGHGWALIIVAAVNVHAALHITEDLGYSLALASLVMTAITAGQMGGTVLAGAIGDRFDKRLIAVSCMAGHTLGLLFLAVFSQVFFLFAFAVLHGVAWGLRGPMMQAIRADYFGRTYYGAILGTSSLVTMWGSIIGPLVAGIMADLTGTYEAGFIFLAILSGMGAIFFLMTKKPVHPDLRAQEQGIERV